MTRIAHGLGASAHRSSWIVVLAALCALWGAAPASAVEHHPTGDFAPFADCPLSNASTELCLVAESESGSLTTGRKTVPITDPITLQGGLHELKEEELELIAAEDGNTLSRSPQTVPGGLLGVVAPEVLPPLVRTILNEAINKGPTGVTATTELAAPASTIRMNLNHLVEGEGTTFVLPVKVKLDNPFLGPNCYIGSNAHPIDLALTTGTTSPPPPNEPISGKVGTVKFTDNFDITVITENSLVDNAFAVPGAQGCGGLLSLVVDPAVDAEIGLPSTAGHNAAILNGTLKEAVAEAVLASE
jgi:hypothetical protein